MGFQSLTIIMFLAAVIIILAIMLVKERQAYFTATRMIKGDELKQYILRDDEVCLHKYALKHSGGVVWITDQRVIHRRSHQFSLLFFAELSLIQRVEKEDNMVVMVMQDGRKQRLELFPENVDRVFNVLAKQLMNG